MISNRGDNSGTLLCCIKLLVTSRATMCLNCNNYFRALGDTKHCGIFFAFILSSDVTINE